MGGSLPAGLIVKTNKWVPFVGGPDMVRWKTNKTFLAPVGRCFNGLCRGLIPFRARSGTESKKTSKGLPGSTGTQAPKRL